MYLFSLLTKFIVHFKWNNLSISNISYLQIFLDFNGLKMPSVNVIYFYSDTEI